MDSKHTKNFIFVGEKDLVGKVITDFSAALSVQENQGVKKKNEYFEKHRFTQKKQTVDITGCYEGSDCPTPDATREKLFKTALTAVFFILKAPNAFAKLDVRGMKSNFESSVRQAHLDGLPKSTPVFLIFTGATDTDKTNLPSKLFDSVRVNSSRSNKFKTFLCFKKDQKKPNDFSTQHFRGVFYCPVENQELFNLIFDEKKEDAFENIVYEVIKKAATPSSDVSGKNASPVTISSSSSSPPVSDAKSTTSVLPTKKPEDNQPEMHFIEEEEEEKQTQLNDSRKKSTGSPLNSKKKREKEEEKNEEKGESTFEKATGTGLGFETIVNKYHAIYAKNPLRHVLKRVGVAGLLSSLFIAIAAAIAEAASSSLLFANFSGGILFNLISSTFLSALGPIGFFALAAGMSIMLIMAATALYGYYRNTNFHHLEFSGKVAFAIVTLGVISIIIVDSIFHGAVFEAMSFSPMLLVAYCSIWFVISVVGAAIAATASIAIENKKASVSSDKEDVFLSSRDALIKPFESESKQESTAPESPISQSKEAKKDLESKSSLLDESPNTSNML